MEEVEILGSTLKEVASPLTMPLLSFLLNFVEETDYLGVVQDTKDEALWEIGQIALTPSKSHTNSAQIPDESAQDQDDFLKIINGDGLQKVPPGTTVGCP